MDQKHLKIAFVGGGNMAQAIIRGLLRSGHAAGAIAVADPDSRQRGALADIDPHISVRADNHEILAGADIVVLAVKPQIMAAVAGALAGNIDADRQLIVSIAAGIRMTSLAAWCGEAARIVRVMPNQPALIGRGMSGLFARQNVDAQARDAVSYVMRATGEICWFAEESQLDAVTAISGSGPAYFYLVMEIIQAIGEELGFDPDTARALSVQTALGAGQVAAGSDSDLARLREQVTSPGGTTEAALRQLESAGIRDIFRKALYAAHERSIELGQLADSNEDTDTPA